MSSPKNQQLYIMSIPFRNDLSLLKDVLTLYSTIENINMSNSEDSPTGDFSTKKTSMYLRPRLVEVLLHYVNSGYSNETKKKIKRILNIDTKNLNQINSELTKKGYLVRYGINDRNRELNTNLKVLRDYFLESSNADSPDKKIKLLGIRFTHED